MEIWNKLEDGFFEFLDNRLVTVLCSAMVFFGTLLFFGFWFSIYLISMPLKWLWVNRLREGVRQVLKEDNLKH